MGKRKLIHVGIDNSLSGALAAIDSESGKVLSWLSMPIKLDADNDKEVDLDAIEKFIQELPCDDYLSDVIITLEKPYKVSKGNNAVQIMWYCYGMIKGRFENTDYQFYTVNPKAWQFNILGSFPTGDSKKYAEKKILELHGQKFGKNQKIQGGVHDAILIAEYQRRQHAKIGR